jgi:DNA-binding beta-propeller fold protein YncE
MERLRAPELQPARAWLGTPRPLRLRELRGHVVILDFWTSCCVNCMHVIPVLRDLERRHAGRPLVVIGVHSAKFPGEAAPERVADAMARHAVEHPVVVDDDFAIWERYAIRSWPTLVVIRPDGTIAAVAPGEPDPAALDGIVRALLAEAEAAGTIAAAPLAIPRDPPPAPRPLLFPGKAVVAPDGRIAVSDSGHHRVLVLSAAGDVLVTIGSGRRGHADGPLADARLDDPQGLAWDGDALWIADARSHTLRRADLARGRIDTVAGTGSMGHAPIARSSPGPRTALRSPWDVLPVGDRLLVCLAGSHQIGVVGPDGAVDRFAGDGREALVDGPPDVSCWAQPSGLARAGDTVYVADSETSAIRAIDLRTGVARTIVGEGLFDWGAADGPLATARLQHPLGVAATADDNLVVADTFNNSLRTIDLAAGVVTTLSPGTELREPGGVAVTPDGGLLVADTGNHRLVRLDAGGRFAGEVVVRGAPPLPTGDDDPPPALSAAPATRWFDVAVDPVPRLAPGPATLRLHLHAPAGWKFNAGAPLRLALEVSRRSDLVTTAERLALTGQGETDMSLTIAVTVAALPAPEIRSELLVQVDAILCGGDPEVCAPSRAWLRIPLLLDGTGTPEHAVDLPLAAPA